MRCLSPREGRRRDRTLLLLPGLPAKLTKVAAQGYVLLDLYDLNAIQVYPVEDGAEYPIRIYSVAMAHDEEQGHLVVTNIGHLF